MKILKWAGILLVAGIIGWLAAMTIHASHAKGHPNGGLEISKHALYELAVKDDEAGPRWKIVVTMEGPDGKQSLTYGSKEEGAHWYASKEECEAARKGGDAKLAHGLKQLHAQLKQMKVPVEVTVVCKPDNSV